MKFARISVLLVAAAFAPIASHAAEDTVPTITVDYSELNLNSTQGAAKLYARLRGAARQVCAVHEGRELKRVEAWKACYTESLAKAVEQVNHKSVTALHQRTQHDKPA